MMDVQPIRTKADHKAVLKLVSRLVDLDPAPHPARQHVSRRTFTPTRANTVSSFGAPMRRAQIGRAHV